MRNNKLIWLVTLAYLLSGLASLSYEVLWLRMLAIQFGVSTFGVVVTVAAFMAGLGAGCLLAIRWLKRATFPLLILGLFEIVVALYATLLSSIFNLADHWLTMMAGGSSHTVWLTLEGFASFLFLMLPAMLMGAGFPLLLGAVKGRSVSLGLLYGLNTLGGALGALMPLVLLPWIGWQAALYVTATINFFVGVYFIAISPFYRRKTSSDENPSKFNFHVLLPYAGIGFASLLLEVAWVRLFGMMLLRTEYVLALLLFTFLAGIGFGSLLAGKMKKRWWLNILPFCACLFVLMSLWLLPWVAEWAEQSSFQSLTQALVWQGVVIALLTFPVTLILGAWLPLISGGYQQQNISGPWLYGVNSIGAAAGAVVAGFVLIPGVGTTATIVLGGVSLYLIGLYWATTRNVLIFSPLLFLLAWPVWEFPGVNLLLPTSQAEADDLLRYEDAFSITHVVSQPSGQRLLLSDLQRMDASSDPTSVVLQKNQARLPLLLHPQPKSVLFLGLGTGITASGALAFPELDITAVELSMGAIEAAAGLFSPVNDKVTEKISIEQTDGRRFLRVDEKSFDVIVGDVFHPDLVGRGGMLSVQQFQRVYDRLSDSGLFTQWLALNQFDAYSLSVVLRSFQQVFPQAIIFLDGFRLALVGPKKGEITANHLLQRYDHLSVHEQNMATGNEGKWSWLARYFGKVKQLDLIPGPIQDEWEPIIEYYLPTTKRLEQSKQLMTLLQWLLKNRPTVSVSAEQLNVSQNNQVEFKRAYAATLFTVQAWLSGLEGDEQRVQRLLSLAYKANPQDYWVKSSLADKMLQTLPDAYSTGKRLHQALSQILSINNSHIPSMKRLWRFELEAGNQEAAQKLYQRLKRLSPLDQELATAVTYN